MMKKLLFICFIVCTFVNCTTTYYTEDGRQISKDEHNALVAEQIQNALNDRHYVIDVLTAIPQRGRMMNLSSGFSVEIKGDSIISNLPYFGRAYNLPYGGGKGLTFTELYRDYRVSHPKADLTSIYINVDNKEDILDYKIDVYDDGESSIELITRNRDRMYYRGELNLRSTR